MFKLAQSETFKIKVEGEIVGESGKWEKFDFMAVFKRAAEEDRPALLELPNVDLVKDRLVGWDMRDEKGAEVPFDDATKQAFLSLTGPVREATLAFWRGNVGAREGNSQRRPGTGLA